MTGEIIDKSQIDKAFYQKLKIEIMEPFIMNTKKGKVKFPVNGGRMNAFICAWCGISPYTDPFGKGTEVLPMSLYLQSGKRGEITFHFKCAQEVIGFDV